jgi:signal transduction histidine kinase
VVVGGPAVYREGTMSAEPPELTPITSRRDRIVDLTCIGLALLLGAVAFGLSSDLETAPRPLLALDLGTGLASCLALWWRRRWPLEIAVVVGAVSAFSQVSTGAALIMVFTVALHRQARAVAVVAVLNVFTAYVLTVLRPEPTTTPVLEISFAILVVLATVAWGMYLRARRQLVSSLRERAERAETEQELRIDQARQRERRRIAREMHDVLGHRISLISMHAGALELRARSAGEELIESAAVIRASAHQALEDLREVIGVLGAEPEEQPSQRPQPTLGDVAALVAESQDAGMNITFNYTVPENANALPASVGRTAYRVVQEGLTNARKHAPGAAILVQVNGSPGPGLSVEVRNRPLVGEPLPSAPGASRGLLGLAERAALVGGRLQHGRTPDGDFLLQSWLPWSAWRVSERESRENQDV